MVVEEMLAFCEGLSNPKLGVGPTGVASGGDHVQHFGAIDEVSRSLSGAAGTSWDNSLHCWTRSTENAMDEWTVLYAVAGCSVLLFLVTKVRAPGFRVDGKHVFITGGSSGIGLATAKKYARAGANVSIIARDAKKLDAAKQEIEAVRKHADVPVFTQSCDVIDPEAVKKAVKAANAFHKRATDHVVCSAGIVEPGYFMDQDVAGFKRSMDINYFGSLHVVHAALPAMIQQHESERGQEGGQIVLVGSAFSLMACIGTAQYSSSKYALRGLAESLRNELKLYDIRVSIFYPGNVDTPMLKHEMALTPPETKTIEGVSTPLSPDAAAQTLVNGIAKGHFSITTDPLVYLLRILSNGVTPMHNTVLEAVALPLIVVIQVAFLWFMDGVVQYSRWQRTKQRKSEKKGQ
ncbi:hypothetical protein PHYSODRAFT_346972 [Phytophthora sojae]|uniref:3-dehydrosphinganine reductase n=1 Tax=Phytophthora sojae (strain P6497) TaxID=1094619 RepID=G4ZTZ9_PHYSP|nr:hypothetical protein PHYSODRAFT_346972 [Phytophthora sojae]EGZ13273.1 hypothetical protein PHYSODRAFT_346972 [Phytophthora sojae]|eukprot:XP_009530702.1 hypothetical protein PHYSODRAFT_346972 [Phytophthora sojae]